MIKGIFTRKQERFIENYVNNPFLSQGKIAIMSGYSAKGDRVSAARLLASDNIKAAIARRQQGELEKLEISEESILKRLWKEADTAVRAGDRIQALNILSKIKGMQKEVTTQSIALFGSYADDLRKFRGYMNRAINTEQELLSDGETVTDGKKESEALITDGSKLT